MSWMRILFALLLPLCGDGSYNNYRLSMLADEHLLWTVKAMMMKMGLNISQNENGVFTQLLHCMRPCNFQSPEPRYPDKIILLTLFSFQSLDQFVSEDNLIFSADFAEMRDI